MSDYTRGRKTVYKGVTMRSRLEASYAAYLDRLGLRWLYEPQCFADAGGQYLPDFEVEPGQGQPTYYEVKPPTANTGEALSKMHIIRSSQPSANLFVVVPTGNYPNQDWATVGACVKPAHLCAHCLDQPFRDARVVPGADRSVGRTDPVTGRATIGGRARRDTQYITPKEHP